MKTSLRFSVYEIFLKKFEGKGKKIQSNSIATTDKITFGCIRKNEIKLNEIYNNKKRCFWFMKERGGNIGDI